ncbi:CYTH domain-containing protein [Catenovulum sp. 2E275]|uniref:CYTH and CHAD domain-containing protein n=1 Tax=Catenovulum sp. 2E275 TaxID=2980497 RepID=UPI0021CED412|nr:CYTH domain-containing protein [Catenovulum sp. 2E275]MCU4674317.1 CYTH domain-containing protein [Catenovulum sp. 2E275]
MDTEIELKFAVASEQIIDSCDVKTQLDDLLLPMLKTDGYNCKKLINTYFDTPNQQLRAYDFGLRIRTRDSASEQTLKTAGRVVGGLHKRPEYNIDIDNTQQPDLSLFPADVWPEPHLVNELQQNLVPLFTTHFTRHLWLINYQNSVVEVVFDSGEVSSENKSLDIREIELELIDGDMRQLFELANVLTEKLPLRLSNDSKAARGYRLFLGKELHNKPEIGMCKLSTDMTVEQAFQQSIEHGLAYWQYHEEVYCQQQHLSNLQQLIKGVYLVRHTLNLYREYIPKKAGSQIWLDIKWLIREFSWLDEAVHIKQLTSKKGIYRKKIAEDEQLISYLEASRKGLQQESDVINLFYSKRYSQLILTLMRWLVERGWRCYSEINEEKISQNIGAIAAQLNQQDWEKLKHMMPVKQEFDAQDYIQVEKYVGRGLLSGASIGALFDSEERSDFRAPWLDILQGIFELKTLALFNESLTNYQGDNGQELKVWGDTKISNLVRVLEQSRQSALKMTPYW